VVSVTSATIPDLPDFETYYGVQVSDIGEDGDVIILGHHDKRRALAALNRHARTFWGLTNLYDGATTVSPAVDNLRERWAVLLTKCENADGPDHEGRCYRCEDIASSSWWIDYSADETASGAFPVMMWRA
jgi:hypothetical protein